MILVSLGKNFVSDFESLKLKLYDSVYVVL